MSQHNETQIASDAVARAVELAIQSGNSVKAISADLRPKQVVFMAEPLQREARAAIEAACPGLERYASKRTPHNPPDEGFVCRADDVAISFPVAGQPSWY